MTGAISYDPDNHDAMVGCARRRWQGSPPTSPSSTSTTGRDADLLVVGWGSTYGPIGAAVRRVRKRGISIARAHFHHLSPFPANTGEVLRRYPGCSSPR